MNLMTVQSLYITHGTKRGFFRFPQTKVIDFIFVRSDSLSFLTILIQPEDQDTNHSNVENHTMGLGQYLLNERVKIPQIILQAQAQYKNGNNNQDNGRG